MTLADDALKRTEDGTIDFAAMPDEQFAEWVGKHDLYHPDLQRDPAAFEKELQRRHPLARSESHGGYWMVTKFSDAWEIMRDTDRFSNELAVLPHREFPYGRQIPVELDPPVHTKYRQALANPFRADSVAVIEPLVRRAARRMIRDIRTAGVADFEADYAVPLPAEAFLHMFRLPSEDLEDFVRLKNELIENRISGTFDQDKVGIADYFQARLEERRGGDGDDIITMLSKAVVDGRPWTDGEIVNCLMVLMLASLDTTTSFLTFVFAHLERDRELRSQLIEDPLLIRPAIEEFLRYEPITSNGRLVTEDVEVRGQQLKAGDQVMILLRAVNRDPEQTSDPDRIDIRRPAKHLALGAGPHRCLGMHLARLVVRVAIEEWLEEFPDFRQDPEVTPKPRYTVVRATKDLRFLV